VASGNLHCNFYTQFFFLSVLHNCCQIVCCVPSPILGKSTSDWLKTNSKRSFVSYNHNRKEIERRIWHISYIISLCFYVPIGSLLDSIRTLYDANNHYWLAICELSDSGFCLMTKDVLRSSKFVSEAKSWCTVCIQLYLINQQWSLGVNLLEKLFGLYSEINDCPSVQWW